MASPHAVVWIDHREARVIDFSPDEHHRTVVRNPRAPRQVHHRAGSVGSGHATDDHHYFDEVVRAVGDAAEVLLVGPAATKQRLKQHIDQHWHEVARRVVGVETLDHPSDAQLLAFARRAFTRIDGLIGG